MKSIKFLAALAIPAMFAACTNEELDAVQQEVQQGKEFIGAELVGSGISLNFGTGVESRLYGNTWSDDDKLGLGWVVAGEYGSPQSVENAPDKENLFGNHMFYKAEDGSFTSKGNIYKGWHFAYFPYAYMEELGEEKTLAINPIQKEDWDTDRYNTGLYLSARKFLSKKDLDEETFQLKEKNFSMYRANNTIGVTIKPNETFTGSNVLANLAVKSITVETASGIFNKTVKVNPTKLPEFQYDNNGIYNEGKTKEAVKNSLSNVLTGSRYKSTTTTINNSAINLSADQTLRIHTLASNAVNLDKTKVKFTIEVEGGKFIVGYTTKEDPSDEELNNNATIEALVAAYKVGGAMTTPGGVLYDTAEKPFNLQLTKDMFSPYFENIRSEQEWNNAVLVADALEMTDAEFTIAKGVDGNKWKFTDVDNDGNLINLPLCALTVKGEDMILSAEGTWPTEGLTVATNVVINANLTVEGEMEVTSGYTITNNATIYAGDEAAISNKNAMALNNASGRVIVEYGAYVYTSQNNEGTIAYEVKKTTFEDIKKINTLIATDNNDGNAHVNTLIVKTVLDLNAQAVEGATVGDRYNSTTTPDDFLTDLSNIYVELHGGKLVHYLPGGNTTVKNVKAVNGRNTIDDVVVAENIETVENATLNVDNTVVTEIAKPYFANVINNNGTLNSNVATLNVNKVDNHAGTINVATGKFIYYADEYIQGGSVKGWIIKASAGSDSQDVTTKDLEKDGSNYTVYTALGLKKLAEQKITDANVVITLANDIDLAGIKWTGLNIWNAEKPAKINGNGKTIKNLTGNVGLIKEATANIENLTIDGASIYIPASSSGIGAVAGNLYGTVKNITVQNVEIAGNKNLRPIRVGAIVGMHNKGNAENCVVNNAKIVDIYHNIGGISGTVNETNNRTYSNCIVMDSNFSSSINHSAVGAITNANGVTLTLDNCKAINTTPSKLYGVGAGFVTVK